MRIVTDYLVAGAGASGLAFLDSLVAEADDAEVVVVERRAAPGGHWVDAYPFVRLHIPSAYYGVGSLPLGEDRIDAGGENAGCYERATGAEVRAHFEAAAERLAATGRVRFLYEHELAGDVVRDLATGAVHDVRVRRRIVDARYLEASVPATHTPSFAVAADARFVPVNGLDPDAGTFTILGAGKTAIDAITRLVDHGVEPGRIRWVKPRDMWLNHRRDFQPLDRVGSVMRGISLDAEAGANATDADDLCERLEANGRMFRVDPSQPATMFRGTMVSDHELAALRSVEDVVRLGRVTRVEADRIVLERGEIPSSRDTLVVDCTALGLRAAPPVPIFQPGRIVLQQVRHNSPPFNAALLGFLEARRDDDAERNRLTPPNPYPSTMDDWPRMMSTTWTAEGRWLREPDLSGWIAQSRLNLLPGLPEHLAEPETQAAVERFVAHVGPAIKRLREIDAARAGAAATA